MYVKQLSESLQQEASDRPYSLRLQVVEQTASLLKTRLHVTRGLYVQIYRNDRFDTTNLAFQPFTSEAGHQSKALAYPAVPAALRLESGVPFHVKTAKQLGASREEVISAVLVVLPAAGHVVTQVLPAALAAYDVARDGVHRFPG